MKKLLSNYGMILVLIALCLLFSILTLKRESPTGAASSDRMIEQVTAGFGKEEIILAVGAANKESGEFAARVASGLKEKGWSATREVVGTPRDLRQALDRLQEEGGTPSAIVGSGDVQKWSVWEKIGTDYPAFAGVREFVPEAKLWPDFLKRSNLLAIVDRIVVIAVIAIGMTMVILTGGIDLSVGSLIALSAVIGTLVMKAMGGLEAGAGAVFVGFLCAIVACGLIGGGGGWLVSRFRVAPFITTLAIMMVARGLAFKLTGGFSIYQVPKSLTWLGQGTTLGIPNTVILLVLLYGAAHVFMSHTKYGRYIYAVGGNEEAARLAGVPVKKVIIFVYLVAGICAGFGGCIQASQLNTGAPNLGMMFELYVIAAVVVGGTSLSGGSGRILGTLIGAFIISVIQNGMNLIGFDSYTQQIVLGGVILGAVLLDRIRSKAAISAA